MNLNTKRVRAEAKKQGLTQRNVATTTGLSYECINQVFRGMSCSEKTALKIAECLNLPLYDLLERTTK